MVKNYLELPSTINFKIVDIKNAIASNNTQLIKTYYMLLKLYLRDNNYDSTTAGALREVEDFLLNEKISKC